MINIKLVRNSIILVCILCISSGAFSQYYFGRNKIQYDDFRWNILKTEHYDVYFYPEMRELAEIGAAMAEDAYTRLESKLNHNITRRIPLIFYSNHIHFQQTNTIPNFISEGVGGFFEFIKGRVVIPSTGSIHDFKHVINHEMVHVFTRSKLGRGYKDRRRTLFAGAPLWFTEGIAEYWSEGWDSQAEMFIRDAMLSGYLVPVSQMDRIYGTFLMYKEGQAICRFIAENFGEEKLLLLLENAWKAERFSEVMKLTIGLNYKEFDKKWIYDLKKKIYPLLDEGDEPYQVTKEFTQAGFNTKPAYFKKDGEDWVAFTANRMGYSNIYIKPLGVENKSPEVLVKGERTPDYESFYLLKSKLDVNDSGKLTFISKSGARDALYVYDISTRENTRKFDFPDLVSLSSPHWSPDEKVIVFSGKSFAGQPDLYTLTVETGDLQRLTNDFYDDKDPEWSPDGKTIAFSSDRSYYGKEGVKNLFLYEVLTGQIRHITCGPYNDFSPTWSPDGQNIVFSSDRDGTFNLWMLKNNTFNFEPFDDNSLVVASLDNGDIQPDYTKNDGQLDSFDSVDGVLKNLYPSAIEPADEIKKITNFTTGAQDAEWVDNNRLIFSAFQGFSFQIRELNDIQKKFAEADTVVHDVVTGTNDIWVPNKIVGQVDATQIKYKKKFNLDIAQSAIAHDPVYGSTGGAQLAMSDMLGNQKYFFLLYNNAQRSSEFFKSWNFAVTRVDLGRRVNTAVGLFRISGRFFDRVDSFFDQERVGGFVSASYPFSVFNRIEGSISLRKERREYLNRSINGIIASNSISYVKDNTLWGVTGPVDGERYNVTVGHTLDIQNNDVSFFTFTTDYRKYFRLSRRTTYATRVMGRFNVGKESFRYFMGGSWDLRLYPRWRIWGRKLFLLNNEVRFPLLDRLILGFPFGGLGFGGFQGAAFVDLGQAWDSEYHFEEVLGSMGLGIRMRFGGFLVLRYEIGRTFQVNDLSNPSLHWDSGLKKAFWFGLDF